MITDEVIREIYNTNKKPPKNLNELGLHDVIYDLKRHHNIEISDDDLTRAEVVINDLGEYDPFRCFLVRSLHAILDIDNVIAFVFKNHILFLGKHDNQLRVHFKPQEEDEMDFEDEEDEVDGRSFFARLFGRKGH